MSLTGKIFKGIGGFYYVHTSEGDYECRAKGVFRNRNEKPVVGDMAEIEPKEDSEKQRQGNVIRILPRKNLLVRPEVSNVDQAVIVVSLKDPAPNLNMLDRFLINMEQLEIPVIIFFNKSDLVSDSREEAEEMRIVRIYQSIGYKTLVLNTRTNQYLPDILKILEGKTSVLSGPSGVGKSTLTNMIHPEAKMATGEISRKIKRGRNTTRHAEFFYIGDHTYILDTPGFTSLYVREIPSDRLMYYYPEFESYRTRCRFHNCVHIGEKDCAVKRAVQEGKISEERYASYVQLYQELKEQEQHY